MSVYVPPLVVGSVIDMDAVTNSIQNDLPSRQALSYINSGLITVVATATTNAISQSFTCAVDDLVKIDFTLIMSQDNIGRSGQILVDLDGGGTIIAEDIANLAVNTAGTGSVITGSFHQKDLSAGSHTIHVKIFAGSGTLYCLRQNCFIETTKRRT